MQLTEGNHDYWQKNGDEAYKNNMVYYYKYDAFDVDEHYSSHEEKAGKLSVKDILDNSAVVAIKGQTPEAFLAMGGAIEVKELTAGRTAIGNSEKYAGYNNHIEPYFSNNSDDYLVRKTIGGFKKAPEEFYVNYTATTADGNVYVTERLVKITYRTGDTYLSGSYSGLVTADIIAYIGGAYYVVMNTQEQIDNTGVVANMDACRLLMDINGDGTINGLDTAYMINIIGKGGTAEYPLPDFRK